MVKLMKKILIYFIKLYQKIPGPWHNHCRYTPTCSDYIIISITKYGSFKGLYLGIKRILRCNPFGSYGYDPVPIKEEEKCQN